MWCSRVHDCCSHIIAAPGSRLTLRVGIAGNPDLALSVYKAMSLVGRSGGGHKSDASPTGAAASGWPPATLLTVRALVLGLARTLRVADAIRQAGSYI